MATNPVQGAGRLRVPAAGHVDPPSLSEAEVSVVLQRSVGAVRAWAARETEARLQRLPDGRFATVGVIDLAEALVEQGELTPLALWVLRLVLDGDAGVDETGPADVPPTPAIDVLADGRKS